MSVRPSHLQVISLSALKKWKLWSLDIKNAFLQANPFPREVNLHAPVEWCPKNPNRVWTLNAPAYGLNDAPVESRETLKRYLLQSVNSLKLVGPRFEVSTLSTMPRRRRRGSSPRTSMIFCFVGLRVSLIALAITWNNALAH